MTNQDEHLYSVVQSAIEIASPSDRKEFLNRSCVGKPGLRTRLQAIVDALPENEPQSENPIRSSEDSVLQSIAPNRAPSVVLDDSLLLEAEPVIQPTSVEIPKTIESSRYQLQGEVARGGMGVVIKGRDTDLGRNLAIKVLLDEHKDNPQVIQRFIEEAQIGGQLQHPGIAPVYELGQFEDRRPFFTMKLVKGETLAYMLSGRRSIEQDRSRLLGIFEQVCQTMAYAHSRHVIHRDLKPANIMVGAFGEVQVMDWGLAKVLSEKDSCNAKPKGANEGKSIIATFRSAGSDAPLPLAGSAGSRASDTQLGSAMGTPAYMPPEQALGDVDHMDRRSDVFGLGAILCEILTGEPPYLADDIHALMRLACRGNIDDCSKRLASCGADGELVQLVKDCLAFESRDRPKDAGEVAYRLTAYLESVESKIKQTEIQRAEQSARAKEEVKRRSVTLALAASILFLLALGGSGWMLHMNQVAEQQATAIRQFEDILNDAKLHSALADNPNLALRQQELELALQSTQAALNAPPDALPTHLVDVARNLDADFRRQLNDTKLVIEKQDSNRSLVEELELIRVAHADSLKASSGPFSGFDSVSTSDKYARVFSEAGLDLRGSPESKLAEVITDSEVREELITALDHWLRTLPAITGAEAYSALVSNARWKEAFVQAEKNLAADPDNVHRYAELAYVSVLAGQKDRYIELARTMCDRFVTSLNKYDSGVTTKVCLLLPDAIELDAIPTRVHEEIIEQELVSESEFPVAYGTRAMLAYRRGNLDVASVFIDTAMQADIGWDTALGRFARLYLLAIRAMIQHDTGNQEKALATLKELQTGIVEGELNRYTPLLLTHALEVEQHLGVPPSTELVRLAKGNISNGESHPSMKRERLRSKLISVVELVDSNSFRKQVRTAILTGVHEELVGLVSSPEAMQQPPVIIAWLGASLRESKQLDASIDLLSEAQALHPGDFWINYGLALAHRDSARLGQALGFARTAYSKRPNSVAAQWLMIESLVGLKKIDEAEGPVQRMLLSDGLSSDAKVQLAFKLNKLDARPLAKLIVEKVLLEEPENIRALLASAMLKTVDRQFDEAFQINERLIRLAPESFEGYFMQAFTHMVSGDPEQALKNAERVVELNPKEPAVHGFQGQILFRLERTDDAIACFRRALAIDSKHELSRKMLTNLLMEKANSSGEGAVEALMSIDGSFRSQQKHLLAAISKDPRDRKARAQLAKLYFLRAMYPEVLEQADWLLRFNEKDAIAYGMRGRVLHAQGRLDESIEVLRKATALAPQGHLLRYRLGRVLEDKAIQLIQEDPDNSEGLDFHDQAMGVYQEGCAIELYTACRRPLLHALEMRGMSKQVDDIVNKFAKLPEQDTIKSLVDEALFWIEENELAWALESLQEVLAIDPSHSVALLTQCSVFGVQLQYRKSLEVARKLSDYDWSPKVQLEIANLEGMTGQFDAATERITELLAHEPKMPQARAVLATILMEQGKVEEAVAECRVAIREVRSDFSAHSALALCVADGHFEKERTGEILEEAERQARIGIRGAINSRNFFHESTALANLGIVYYRQGEWQKAVDTLGESRLLSLPPLLTYRPEYLAMAHWQLGEKDQARKWLTVAEDHFEMHDVLLPSQKRIWAEARSMIVGEK